MSDISYTIDCNSSGAINGFKNVSNAIGNLKNAGKGMEDIGGFMEQAMAVDKLKEMGAQITNVADKFMEYATTIRKAASQTNMTTDQVQELRYMCSQTGQEFDVVVAAAARLTKSLAGAGSGTTLAAKSLKALKIDTKDAAGNTRQFGDLFPEIIGKLGNMTNIMERNELASELFGKSYNQLIPIMNAGGEKINQLADRAKRLNLIMGPDSLNVAKKYGLMQKELKMEFDFLSYRIGAAVIPILLKLMPVMAQLIPVFEQIIGIIVKVIGLFTSMPESVQQAAAMFIILAPAIMSAVMTLGLFMSAMAAVGTPILVSIAAIAGLAVASSTLGFNMESLGAVIAGAWNYIANVIEGAISYIGTLWNQYGTAIIDSMMAAWEALVAFCYPVWEAMVSGVMAMYQSIQPIWESLKTLFASLGTYLMALFEVVKPILETIGIAVVILFGVWLTAWDAMMTSAGSAVQAIVNSLKWLVNTATAAADVLKSVWSAAALALSGDFAGAGVAISGGFGEAWKKFEEGGNNALDAGKSIIGAYTGLFQGAVSGATGYAESVSNAFSSIGKNLPDIQKKWTDAINGTGKPLDARLQFKGFSLPKLDPNWVKNAADTTKDFSIDVSDLSADLGDFGDALSGSGDSAKKMADDFKSVGDAIKQQSAQFENFIGLFDKVEHKGTSSGESLLRNLKKQTEEMNVWKNSMDLLKARLGEGNEGLYQELLKMGPGAARQVGGLAKLSDEKLQEYTGLFAQKQGTAWQEAKQVVKYEHSGTILVKGINKEEELQYIAQIVADDIAKGQDNYSANSGTNKMFK